MKILVWMALAAVAVPLAAQEPAEPDELPLPTAEYFYRAGFLALEGEVQPLGRVDGGRFPAVGARELPPQVQLYDRIYVTLGAADALRVGDRLHLHRAGRLIQPYGRLYEPTGIVAVEAVEGDLATAVVVQLYARMSVGDLAFPFLEPPVPVGVPRPVSGEDLVGSVVAFQSPGALPMIEDVAILDLGALSGVREGDEFVAYLPGHLGRRGWRPEVEVARLRVARVGERTAAARVVAMDFPALEPGLAVRRVARVP